MKQTSSDDFEDVVLSTDTEEIVLPEDAEISEEVCKKKIQNLRSALRVCQKERDEHLAGWQRAKADIINTRRTAERDASEGRLKGKIQLLLAFLPALDSL